MTLPAKVNGHKLAAPTDVVVKEIVSEPRHGVPSGDVEWKATSKCAVDGHTIIVRAQTWFGARAAAMATFGCDPHECEVVRA